MKNKVVVIHSHHPARACPRCGWIVSQQEIEQTRATVCPDCRNVPLSSFVQVERAVDYTLPIPSSFDANGSPVE